MGIDVGDLYDCEVTFRVAKATTISGTAYLKGAVADPVTVTLEIMPPDGVKVTHVYGDVGSPVVKDSTGVFHVPILFDQAGHWRVIWTGSGTGSIIASEPAGVVVNQRAFT